MLQKYCSTCSVLPEFNSIIYHKSQALLSLWGQPRKVIQINFKAGLVNSANYISARKHWDLGWTKSIFKAKPTSGSFHSAQGCLHSSYTVNSHLIQMNFLSVPLGKLTQKGVSIMVFFFLKKPTTTSFYKWIARWFRLGPKSISYVLLNQTV